MRTFRAILIAAALAAAALLALPAAAQEGPVSLEGRHSIRLGIGAVSATSTMSAGSSGANVSSDVTVSGVLGYRYWFNPDWGFQIDAGAMEVSSEITANAQNSAVTASTTVSMLAGFRYQPVALALGRTGRPFFELAPGLVAGTTSAVNSNPASVSSDTQTVMAVRGGLGVDWIVHHRISLGVGGYYIWTQDFDLPVAGHDNMTSWGFEFSFGVMLGQGR
jgi:hypothetical protein